MNAPRETQRSVFPFENVSFSLEKGRKEREPISGNYAAKRIMRANTREICIRTYTGGRCKHGERFINMMRLFVRSQSDTIK